MTYRIIAVTLILLGILVTMKAVTKRTHAQSTPITLPIRCDGAVCRTIMPDGSLSNLPVPQPSGPVHQSGGCNE